MSSPLLRGTLGLAAGLIAGCGASATQPAQPPPGSVPMLSLRTAASQAASADEPRAGAGVTVAAPTGARGVGALARGLPVRVRGWRLSLAQISPARGAYLITVVPPRGHRTTLRAAAGVLGAAVRAHGDDPGDYRSLVPMSALAGAHRDRGGR